MIVVCKKETKRIVKGLRYEVQNLWNDGTNQRWLEGKVEIKGFGRYVVSNFTDIDGKPLPKINIVNPRPKYERLEFSSLKVGDILVCTCDSYKTLVKDGFYKIESLSEIDKKNRTWSYKEQSVKFVGIKRSLKFSSWRFRKLSTEESRDISLSSLFGESSTKVITNTVRKIDMTADKEQVLIKLLATSILDVNRHSLSVLDWTTRKTGVKWGVESKDFNSILNMPLKEILEKLDIK